MATKEACVLQRAVTLIALLSLTAAAAGCSSPGTPVAAGSAVPAAPGARDRSAPSGGSGPKRDGRPNVLFISVDDLNDWIGALQGHPGIQTPNIDRLARRGTLFARAYCPAPACNPSRASLLTGKRPSTTGVYYNDQPWRPVMPDAVTLPEHFRANGYQVVGAGKLFHYEEPTAWDQYLPQPEDPKPSVRPLNGLSVRRKFDWGPMDIPDEAMGDYQVTNRAIDYLGQDRDRPFFLAVGLSRPHLPWYTPRSYFDRYPLSDVQLPPVRENDLADVPPAGVELAKPGSDHRTIIRGGQWKNAIQGYMASITFADAQVGRLLDALDRSAHRDNTLVVLWGDHGYHLGEKRHWRKFTLWERGTRTPLIISLPGGKRAGARCQRPVSLLDLYPTLVALCKLSPRPGLEGQNLVSLLNDPSAPWDRPAVMTYGRNNHAVRTARWRYIRYADGSEELYDHEADPMEWTNLAQRSAYAPVKAELARWLPKVNAPDAPRDPNGQD